MPYNRPFYLYVPPDDPLSPRTWHILIVSFAIIGMSLMLLSQYIIDSSLTYPLTNGGVLGYVPCVVIDQPSCLGLFFIGLIVVVIITVIAVVNAIKRGY